MSGILSKKEINKLFILSSVLIPQARRLYNFQKVAFGSLVVSRHIFEGLKKVYSNNSGLSFRYSIPDIYRKIKSWSGLIKYSVEILLTLVFAPIVFALVILYGDELL